MVGSNHGTLENGATYAIGKVGQAFTMDGVDDDVLIPHSNSLNLTDAITLMAWIKSSGSAAYSGIIFKNLKSGKAGYQMGLSNGSVRADFGIGPRYITPLNLKPVLDGDWHLLAATYDRTKALLYVDGVPGAPVQETSPLGVNTSPLVIGNDPGDSGRRFTGLIDEVAIFNRALSSKEIASIYNAGTNGICFTDDPGPVFVQQPVNCVLNSANSVTFTGFAMGVPRPAYQWLFNGAAIPGATTAALTLANLSLTNAGDYALLASNSFGVTVSATASLVLEPQTVVAWGAGSPDSHAIDDYGQATVPIHLTNVVSVSGGYFHTLALRGDGTVAVWGDGSAGQTNVPHGLSNVLAISGGGYHSLALREDGTVVAWGTNDYGQMNVPVGLRDVVSVSAGRAHGLALKADGTITAWGKYNDGTGYYPMVAPAELSNVVAIAGGFSHVMALREDGTVFAWGNNQYGQCNIPAGLSDVIAVAGGGYHSMALCGDGSVVAWGAGSPGGARAYDHGQASIPAGLTDVVAIAAGFLHSLALSAEGNVFAWGWTNHGQTLIPPGLGNAVDVGAGYGHSLALLGPALDAHFHYATDNGAITITTYTGPGGAVIIPNAISGLPVTTIGIVAFSERHNVTAITIPNGVTTIGNGAFESCDSLANARLGASLTAIQDYAFSNCRSLTTMRIPAKVTRIGGAAFSGCSGLTRFTIPDRVTTIGQWTFERCTSLTSVTIGNSVTNIGGGAFGSCTNLKGVYFQGSAPSVGQGVFDGATNATVYYLPGTQGWGTTSGGRPTALWARPDPLILTAGSNLGVQDHRFGFTISWATNTSVVVEAATDLTNPTWSPVSTNTLTDGSSYFSDPGWTKHPAQFYRVRSLLRSN